MEGYRRVLKRSPLPPEVRAGRFPYEGAVKTRDRARHLGRHGDIGSRADLRQPRATGAFHVRASRQVFPIFQSSYSIEMSWPV
jgi:hypothetical protein